jgi:SpoU rRNA methylase family enzyme
MWYDLIVNETGDIIQLLTPDYWELVSSNGERRIDYSTLSEECIPIKDILRSYDPEYYANIEQSLDDCIRVNGQ